VHVKNSLQFTVGECIMQSNVDSLDKWNRYKVKKLKVFDIGESNYLLKTLDYGRNTPFRLPFKDQKKYQKVSCH
jgi:hypothetical protein